MLELPELDALLREAKSVMWAAPCDLLAGAALVDRYAAAVNLRVKETAR